MEAANSSASILFSPVVTTVVGTFLVALLSIVGWVAIQLYKLNGETKVVATQQLHHKELLDLLRSETRAGFEKMDERFAKMDERFVKMDERFVKMDERLAKIDERFIRIDERLSKIDDQFVKMDERLGKIEAGIERLSHERVQAADPAVVAKSER